MQYKKFYEVFCAPQIDPLSTKIDHVWCTFRRKFWDIPVILNAGITSKEVAPFLTIVMSLGGQES